MSNDYSMEQWAFTIVMIVVAGIIYLLGRKVSTLSKYSGATRFFLSMIYSGVIGLVVFYPPAVIDDIYFIGNEYITAMALVFIPMCLVTTVVFFLLFLFKIFRPKKAD